MPTVTDLAAEPHHDGSPRHLDDPAPALGDHVGVRLRVPVGLAVDAVHVRAVNDGEPKYTEAKVAEREPGDDGAVWWRGEVRAVNPVTSYRFLLETSAGSWWVNGAGTWPREVPDRDDFVVTTYDLPPDWLADAVCYEIFPDRFARGIDEQDWVDPEGDWAIECDWDTPIARDWRRAVRQLYRGDLVGVRQRLDHVQRLGANLLYLTPVFPGRSCHRYDASTFDAVDPVLGGDAALAALLDESHRRGIRVIGDLTTNHSGNHHRWFDAAVADASAPEAGYYYFTEHPHSYVGWFDVPTLPKFDLRSTALRDVLVDGPDSVLARWLDGSRSGGGGLDGWRIDVGNMTGRHGAIDVNHDVFRAARATIAAVRPDSWLVGEHFYDATGDLAGDGWHGVMAYSWFTRPVWSWLAQPAARLGGVPGPLPAIGGDGLVATARAMMAGVPWHSVSASMTLLDSHDTPRFSTVARSPLHQRVGVGLLLTMPGVPMVFAGDEVGVGGASSDAARRPFPWDESEWDHDLLATYRRLIALRRDVEALRRGGMRFVATGAEAIAFVRETAGERVLVHAARATHQPLRVRRGDLGLTGAAEQLYGDGSLAVDDDDTVVELPGDGPAFNVWRISSR
jgi:alpha-glucosidase